MEPCATKRVTSLDTITVRLFSRSDQTPPTRARTPRGMATAANTFRRRSLTHRLQARRTGAPHQRIGRRKRTAHLHPRASESLSVNQVRGRLSSSDDVVRPFENRQPTRSRQERSTSVSGHPTWTQKKPLSTVAPDCTSRIRALMTAGTAKNPLSGKSVACCFRTTISAAALVSPLQLNDPSFGNSAAPHMTVIGCERGDPASYTYALERRRSPSIAGTTISSSSGDSRIGVGTNAA